MRDCLNCHALESRQLIRPRAFFAFVPICKIPNFKRLPQMVDFEPPTKALRSSRNLRREKYISCEQSLGETRYRDSRRYAQARKSKHLRPITSALFPEIHANNMSGKLIRDAWPILATQAIRVLVNPHSIKSR